MGSFLEQVWGDNNVCLVFSGTTNPISSNHAVFVTIVFLANNSSEDFLNFSKNEKEMQQLCNIHTVICCVLFQDLCRDIYKSFEEISWKFDER